LGIQVVTASLQQNHAIFSGAEHQLVLPVFAILRSVMLFKGC
jgi:hypothetical protein